MKTILLATDFSSAARNACLYGIELAKAFNARLILFNAYQQIPVPVSEIPVILPPEDMRIMAEEQLAAETLILKAGNLPVMETACMEGPAAATILQEAKDKHADIIIAGMSGSGKGMRKFLGSAATALARKTSIPLIVVPEDVKYESINSIVLANESDIAPDADTHVMDALRGIAERFHSKVYMVRVTKDRYQEAFEVFNRPFRLTRMIRTLDPVYECVEGKEIDKALNDFIDLAHVNLLAMLPHRHSLLERWFSKSATRTMLFETRIPLLILPDLRLEETTEDRSDEGSRTFIL